MDIFDRYGGWSHLLLVCFGLWVCTVVLVVWTIFPSQADVARACLRKAIEIERGFDYSLRNVDRSQLASRYAGLTGDEAVTLIRDKLQRAYSESLTRAGLLALNKRNLESFASPKASSALLWLDDQPLLTSEAVSNLNSELEQLAQNNQYRLGALQAQQLKTIAFGVLLVFLPMSLLYLLGVLLARAFGQPRTAGNATPGGAWRMPHRISGRRGEPA